MLEWQSSQGHSHATAHPQTGNPKAHRQVLSPLPREQGTGAPQSQCGLPAWGWPMAASLELPAQLCQKLLLPARSILVGWIPNPYHSLQPHPSPFSTSRLGDDVTQVRSRGSGTICLCSTPSSVHLRATDPLICEMGSMIKVPTPQK